MKSKNINIIILAILAITITSCEKILSDIELGDFESKLVVNGLIYNNSPVSLNISNSLYISDISNNTAIENATIELRDKNNITYQFQYDSIGFYHSNDSLVAGMDYIIEVSADGFNTINSAFTLPHKLQVTDIDTNIRKANTDNYYYGGSYALEMSFKVHSNSTEKEYFTVSLTHKYPNIKYDGYYDPQTGEYIEKYDTLNYYEDEMYLWSINPELKLTLDYSYPEEVFNDGYSYGGGELFFEKPEGTKDLKVHVQNDYFTPDSLYKLKVTKIAEDYYKHQLSLARIEYAEYDFLAEKVSLYTNIEKGLGIIAGANTTEIPIDFSEHVKND